MAEQQSFHHCDYAGADRDLRSDHPEHDSGQEKREVLLRGQLRRVQRVLRGAYEEVVVGGRWSVGAIRNRPWLQGSSARPAMQGSKASLV